MFDLKDKVAIVTGSTRGIGRAIAEYYARAGAKVVISSRKQDACEKVAAEMAAAGHEVLAVPCHVARKDELQNLVDRTMEKWGQIDILVCNAATNPVYGPLSELSDEAWDKIMDTNVRGTFWLCNMVLPLMAQKGGGSAILISSIAALRASNNIAAYGVSKAAEISLVRNLAAEWGPRNVRVNAIAPGLVKTDFARALWEDPVRLERIQNATPLRRIGQPEDIAGVALFLASDAAAYVTGHVLVADGGETIV
ncbi:MAG: SDR family oxidoreductase [Xanthomonadaceae bacterium]|nr:SDR family oxidoreductase [Xanthomonadaceae bacterium]